MWVILVKYSVCLFVPPWEDVQVSRPCSRDVHLFFVFPLYSTCVSPVILLNLSCTSSVFRLHFLCMSANIHLYFPYISPLSPLFIPCISPVFKLYFLYISLFSPCLSPIYPLYFPYPSHFPVIFPLYFLCLFHYFPPVCLHELSHFSPSISPLLNNLPLYFLCFFLYFL